MNNVDIVEIKIPAKADYIGVLRLSLSGIANRMGFSYEEIEDLKIAISEAITNAVTHGYNGNEKGEVTVTFGIYEDRLEITVADQGESFDLEEVKDSIGPLNREDSIEEHREGGFGLFLMEALMDEVEIKNSRGGVSVWMSKFLDEVWADIDDDRVSNGS